MPSAARRSRSSGLERQQGLTHKLDVVDADDLHTLAGDGQRDADSGGRAIRLFVLQDLPQEGLPECPTSSGHPNRVKSPALRQQREIVMVRLAEADARVESRCGREPAGGRQGVAALAEIRR